MENKFNNKTMVNTYINVVTGRVLLAEANVDNKGLVSLYIKIAGAEIDIAENSEKAIDMALLNNYDLILMDVNIPETGAMEMISSLNSKKVKIPVVMLSAKEFLDAAEKNISIECSDFLTKPIKLKRFYEVLREYLKLSPNSIIPLKSSLLDNEPELYDLIKKYIHKYPDMIRKLKMAFKELELNTFELLLHDLKSTGGNYGFMLITDLAVIIKTNLSNNNLKAISPLLDELEVLHNRMLLAL